MSDEVLIEERDGVLLITINRPDARNAIDGAVSDGLVAAVSTLNSRDDLRVGVLTGAGDAFCSGMDLKAFAKTGMPAAIGKFMREPGEAAHRSDRGVCARWRSRARVDV